MRPMTEEEKTMFTILKNNPECRLSNEEALREFYLLMYGINIPKLDGVMKIQTVLRMIRTLKSEYPKELTDPEERQIKADMQMIYKERALDRNKPIKPVKEPEKREQIGLGLFGELIR